MPNHVHLIVVPEEPTSLSVALRRTHGRYANYLNARRGRSGHLWQNRFYSCPLEHPRLFVALAYVERNPVRAGMVEKPEQYAWSSAKAHLTGEAAGWLDMELWRETGGAARWQGLLASPEDLLTIRQLQRGTFTGRPVGSDAFVADIETMLQRRLRPQQGVALVARARC
jgi:putative transposase